MTLTQRIDELREDLDKTDHSLQHLAGEVAKIGPSFVSLTKATLSHTLENGQKIDDQAKKICAAYGHKWGLPILKDAKEGDIRLSRKCIVCGEEISHFYFSEHPLSRKKLLKLVKQAIREHFDSPSSLYTPL